MSLFSPDSRKRLKKFWKLLFIASLMVVFQINPWSSLIGIDNHPRLAQAGKDKSDMDGDGVVDLEDLELFSQEVLGLDWQLVDWCQWIEDNPKQESRYADLFDVIKDYFDCEPKPPKITVPTLSNPTVSEINMPSATLGVTIVNDGGAEIYEWGTVWDTSPKPTLHPSSYTSPVTFPYTFSEARTDFTGLEIGTRVYFRGYAVNSAGTGYSPDGSFVVPEPLAVENANDCPTRLALGPSGNLFVSDPKVGSVFIYDPQLQLVGELKGLDSPLGVAVDSNGFIYVGNSRLDRIEKYGPAGNWVAYIGEGETKLPTDLTLDTDNNLYVADKESKVVWVYDGSGVYLMKIGEAEFESPMAVEIAYGTDPSIGELFVADKGNYLVKVFDLQGNLKRSFGGFLEKQGWWNPTWVWQGKFAGLQSLAVDAEGNLHALDIYINKIQILNPLSGDYINFYGEYGTGAGQLKLPLDIIINSAGEVIVANFDNRRVEVIYTIP